MLPGPGSYPLEALFDPSRKVQRRFSESGKRMNQERQASATLDIMTLAEAAVYLRVSKSTLYQRKDIPRHRMPGSREVRFLKDELIAWLKSGDGEALSAASSELVFPLDTANTTVYHRNPKYRG